jgi:hypothetical protein
VMLVVIDDAIDDGGYPMMSSLVARAQNHASCVTCNIEVSQDYSFLRATRI